MDHHRQIDVVEVAEPKEFRLATKKLKPAGLNLACTPADLDVFLSRYREQHQTTGHSVHGLRIHQAHCGVVERTFGLRMTGDNQRIKLAEQRECWTVADSPGKISAHAGQGKTSLRLEPKLAESPLNHAGSLHFLETEFGVPADVLANRYDFIAPAFDRIEYTSLQLILCHVISVIEDLRQRILSRPRE